MHEIVTLQFGHRANHLATHFWNAQESYFTYDSTQPPSPVDHDIHFRPGVNAKGDETFTPRTLIYDLKGGFGGLRKWGGLYDQQQLDIGQAHGGAEDVWDGHVVTHADSQIAQSDYQRSLDSGDPDSHKLSTQTVRYWSDFNRVFYHPRSVIQINDYELGSSLMPFERWESGEDLFASLDQDIDLLDRDVRLWAEECDQMQGMQIYTGGDDAWGGFAAKYVERLRDDYGKTAIWVWGIENDKKDGSRAQQHLRTLNSARTIHEMSAHASMYIPMSISTAQLPQYLLLDPTSPWHSSALLAIALETMTLPSRLRNGHTKRGHLGDLDAALNVNGNQRIAKLQCGILDSENNIPPSTNNVRDAGDDRAPSNVNHTMLDEDEPETVSTKLDVDLSGGSYRFQPALSGENRELNHVFGGVEVIRGLDEAANDHDLDEDDVDYAKKRRRFAGLPVIERYRCSLEFPLLDSFPSIISLQRDLGKVAVHTSLSTTTGISSWVKGLQKHASKIANLDERESLCNGLGEISEAYEDGWHDDSGSDSDD